MITLLWNWQNLQIDPALECLSEAVVQYFRVPNLMFTYHTLFLYMIASIIAANVRFKVLFMEATGCPFIVSNQLHWVGHNQRKCETDTCRYHVCCHWCIFLFSLVTLMLTLSEFSCIASHAPRLTHPRHPLRRRAKPRPTPLWLKLRPVSSPSGECRCERAETCAVIWPRFTPCIGARIRETSSRPHRMANLSYGTVTPQTKYVSHNGRGSAYDQSVSTVTLFWGLSWLVWVWIMWLTYGHTLSLVLFSLLGLLLRFLSHFCCHHFYGDSGMKHQRISTGCC